MSSSLHLAIVGTAVGADFADCLEERTLLVKRLWVSSSHCVGKHCKRPGTQVGSALLLVKLTDMDSQKVYSRGRSQMSAEMGQGWGLIPDPGRLVADDRRKLGDRVHMAERNSMLLGQDYGSCSEHDAVSIHDSA